MASSSTRRVVKRWCGWSRGETSFEFSGQLAGNSLETMLMKFTFPKSHFEIVYNQKETLGRSCKAVSSEELPNDWGEPNLGSMYKNLQGCENIVLKKCFFGEIYIVAWSLFFQEGWWWVEGGDTFDFSGHPAGDSLGTMLMKFTFCKSHFEIVYN